MDVQDSTSIIVKTFERPDCLAQLIRSIREFYPRIPILVADDSRCPLVRDDVDYYVLPFDSGISVGRNLLMEKVQTPYVLYVDDDYVFTPETDIGEVVHILERAPALDLVAGSVLNRWTREIQHYEACTTLENGILRYIPKSRGTVAGCALYDLVLFFFVGRTEKIRAHGWDPDLKVCGVHHDFFLRGRNGGLCAGYYPAFRVDHAPYKSPGYRKYRQRMEYYDLFCAKHGIRELIGEELICKRELLPGAKPLPKP